jgi:hypothetical protein
MTECFRGQVYKHKKCKTCRLISTDVVSMHSLRVERPEQEQRFEVQVMYTGCEVVLIIIN